MTLLYATKINILHERINILCCLVVCRTTMVIVGPYTNKLTAFLILSQLQHQNGW